MAKEQEKVELTPGGKRRSEKAVKASRENGKKGGRSKLTLCEQDVYDLSTIHCTLQEMADIFGCDPTTVLDRFPKAIKEGRAKGKKSLRRKQMEIALGGNVTMLMFLGNHMLDQRDHAKEKEVRTAADEILSFLRGRERGEKAGSNWKAHKKKKEEKK
jgi:hypothetical protein